MVVFQGSSRPEGRMSKKAYSLDLIARTESGRCELSMGLDACSPAERRFLFDMLRRTAKGGSVGFDVQQSGEGEQRLTLLLRQPTVDDAVRQEMPSHANGSH